MYQQPYTQWGEVTYPQQPLAPQPPQHANTTKLVIILVSIVLGFVLLIGGLILGTFVLGFVQAVEHPQQTCTIGITDHLMTLTISGPDAEQDCNTILAGNPTNFLGQVGVSLYRDGIYLDPYQPDEQVICDFTDQGRRIVIRDGGGLALGTQYCQELGQTIDTAP